MKRPENEQRKKLNIENYFGDIEVQNTKSEDKKIMTASSKASEINTNCPQGQNELVGYQKWNAINHIRDA